MLNALLDAYRATPEERDAITAYATERRTLEDIDPQELSAGDRRILLQHAVLLTFADGNQAKEEAEMIAALSAKLRIPEPEAKALIGASVARAKSSLHLLET